MVACPGDQRGEYLCPRLARVPHLNRCGDLGVRVAAWLSAWDQYRPERVGDLDSLGAG
jgi:hypothetical protein